MRTAMKKTKCRQCITGWAIGTPKTFDPWCPGCQEKLALGQRTGKEPMAMRFASHAPKMTGQAYHALGVKMRAVHRGRAAHYAAMMEPRHGQ